MKRIWKKLLCWYGGHKWKEISDSTVICHRCKSIRIWYKVYDPEEITEDLIGDILE